MWPFTPRCPLELDEQAWIEFSLRILIDRIGMDRILAARLVTADNVPAFGTDDLVEQTVRHFCSLLDIDRAAFELKVVPADRLDALGRWEPDPPRILISQQAAATEAGLLSTVAHELMHEFLIRRGYLTGTEPDHEQLTDLATALLGLGIPHANSAFQDVTDSTGLLTFWRAEKRGYLSAMQMGYAMAVVADLRGDDTAGYRRHLRGDARHTFEKGTRFLARRAAPIIELDAGRRIRWPTAQDLLEDLEGRDHCRQICALWQLADAQTDDPSLLQAAVPLLASAVPTVRVNAIRLLRPANHEGLARQLPHLLTDATLKVRVAACHAAVPFLDGNDELTRLVCQMLEERPDALVNAATAALCDTGLRHDIPLDGIIRLLTEAIRRRPELNRMQLLTLLSRHCDDPEMELRKSLQSESDQDSLAELLCELEALTNIRERTNDGEDFRG